MTKNTTPLLSNLPIEKLTPETDFLNILDKGTLIKDFLIGSPGNLKDIKMYALYGDWGSGKSSLMKYLEKELRGEFNTFFFEAWEFEKDENLAMSLLEFITYKSNSTSEKFYDELVKYGGRILRGLAKSVKVNIPLFLNGPAIEINPSAFAEEISQKDPITFFQALDGFKTEFKRLEDHITKGEKPKYNIVFIDDLDRCEPEQILNLMSAIKLFFTYGEKTLFFCGIDKHAVEAAVKTKYGEVVKSNEYLEKIFDISFTMPRHNDIQKLINHYFDETTYKLDTLMIPINEMVHVFFNTVNFISNPRKIKKVLNKYQMLREFIRIKASDNYLTPNIDMKDGKGASHFETLFILYLIILHEFYSVEFENFLDFDKIKIQALRIEGISVEIKNAVDENYSKKALNAISVINENDVDRFNVCFFPININSGSGFVLSTGGASHITSDGTKIDYLFYKYINNISPSIWLDNTSNMSMQSIKELIKNLL